MKPIPSGRSAIRHLLTSGSAVAALLASAAYAQEEDGEVEYAQPAEYAEPAPADSYEVEDTNAIIVTATKRARTLQDTPVAVTVATGESIERTETRDLKDLTILVPSLKVTTLQSSASTNFIIRGFGNGANNAGIEPSVGVFVDNVYRSRSAAQIGDLPDLQRIEVLSGPQSTLFGKNASAGVISIVTAEPKFDFGGKVEASYGNYDAIVGKAMVTGPISETIAASLSGGFNKRDGYVRDLGTGSRSNDRDRWFTRGQLLFEPSALLKVRLIGDYAKIDEICCATTLVQAGPTAGAIALLGGSATDPANPYSDIIYSNFDSSNDIENWGLSGQVDFGFGPFKLTSITAYRGTDALTNQDSDFTSADLLQRNVLDLGVRTFTQELRANAEIADGVNLLAGVFYFNERIKQMGQVQLGSQFRDYADILIQSQSGGAFSVDSLEQQFGALDGDPSKFVGQFFQQGQGTDEGFRLKNNSISLFGQVDWEVTDRLTLTAGLNYTRDKKKFRTDVQSDNAFSYIDLADYQQRATQAGISQTVYSALTMGATGFATPEEIAFFQTNFPDQYLAIVQGVQEATGPISQLSALQILLPVVNVPNPVESGKITDDDLAVTLRAAYEVGDHLNAYISYATGYKAPSVNLSRDSRPTAADIPAIRAIPDLAVPNLKAGTRFAEGEKSRVYEVGLKGNWDQVFFNFAAFKQVIKGFQSNIFTGTGFILQNAGQQNVMGFEFDGTVKPIEPLAIRLALTYLDPKFVSFPVSSVGDLTGTRPAGIPDISMTVGGQYTHEFGSGDALILRADYHYESPVQVIEGLPGFLPLGGTAAIDIARPIKRQVDDVAASVTFAMQNGFELSVWGRNLLDDRYYLSLFDTPAQQFSISSYLNQPRTYGVTARYKF